MSWITPAHMLGHADTPSQTYTKGCSDCSSMCFQIFYPETTDIYDRKNMPRCIYCIHALRYSLCFCLWLVKEAGIRPTLEFAVFYVKKLDDVTELCTMSAQKINVADETYSHLTRARLELCPIFVFSSSTFTLFPIMIWKTAKLYWFKPSCTSRWTSKLQERFSLHVWMICLSVICSFTMTTGHNYTN